MVPRNYDNIQQVVILNEWIKDEINKYSNSYKNIFEAEVEAYTFSVAPCLWMRSSVFDISHYLCTCSST